MAGKSKNDSPSVLITAALTAAVIRLAALAFPGARLWGVDMLRYHDPLLVALFTALPLIAALPFWRGLLEHAFEHIGNTIWNRLFVGSVAVFIIAVAVFPMKTFFYGDGGSLIAEIYRMGSSQGYTGTLLLNLQSAPLAGVLLHGLASGIPTVINTIGMPLPETAHYPFHAVSLIGAAAIGFIIALEKDRAARLPLLLLIWGTGGVLLFFGYVEMYLPVHLAVTAYLLAATGVMRDGRPPWHAILLFILALAAHYMTLALLPTLLFLILRRHTFMRVLTGSWRAILLSAGGIIVAAGLVYLAAGFAHSDSRVVMPLQPVSTDAGTLSYTLLSSWHLLDLINLVLLVALFPLLYLGILFITRRHTLQFDDGLRLQLIAAFFFMLFLLFANTSLGLARDWDIAAPLGAMVALLIFAVQSGEAHAVRLARLLQTGVTAALFMLPWIAVNVDEDASAARFADIMPLDDEHMYGDYALSGYEALRKHALHESDYAREARLLQRMIEVVGYPEQYRLLMTNALLHVRTQPDAYLRLNTWMLGALESQARELRDKKTDRGYAISLWQIDSLGAVVAADAVQYGTARDLYQPMERFARRSGCKSGYELLSATLLYEEGRMAEAAACFSHAWDAGFHDPRMDGLYGSSLFQDGRREAADSVFAEGMQHHGDDAQFLFIAASTYLRDPSRRAEALRLLEKARKCNPPEQARVRIDQLLKALR